jgi:hypothetical protein
MMSVGAVNAEGNLSEESSSGYDVDVDSETAKVTTKYSFILLLMHLLTEPTV